MTPNFSHSALAAAEHELATDERIAAFHEHFVLREFWDCHEVLEDLWKDTPGPERRVVQGILLYAVAFLHLWRGREGDTRRGEAFRRMLATSLTLTAPLREHAHYATVDIARLRASAETWLSRAHASAPGLPTYCDGDIPSHIESNRETIA